MKHDHMRLPNGFGQISKIKSKKLRKPFRAMVTVGKTPEGKPIVKPLKPQSYFRTYNEAYTALLEYKKDPYDFESVITIEELYKKWLPTYKAKVLPGSVRTVTGAWKRCGSIKDMYVKDVKSRHCKSCIESAPNLTGKKNIHKLLNQMFDYAVEYDMTDRNYSRVVTVDKPEITEANNSKKQAHIAFTNDELDTLWKHTDDSIVRMILIQCYSGWRPSELITLLSENIDLENWTMIGGMKTVAGKERLVPVHEKIKGFVEGAKSDGGRYLFTPNLTYQKYIKAFMKVIRDLGLNENHRPHDPRKTFVTMCKKACVDEYAIKYMAGHAIKDITERFYTERDIEFLREELSKVV